MVMTRRLLLLLLYGFWNNAVFVNSFLTASRSSRSHNRHLEASSSSSDELRLKEPPKGTKAYPQQPPHAGCHFRPTHPLCNKRGPVKSERFFEGWYYRITLPEGASFAFIFSIEDPFADSPLSLACHQIMGPNDDYLVQSDPDHTKFWAWKDQQGVGCTFEAQQQDSEPIAAMDPNQFDQTVKSGFQMLPNRLQGKLDGHDGSNGGVLPGQGVAGTCSYDMKITPIAGWGTSAADAGSSQKSTAGWLASYKVFEPHWQVTLADARATGSVTWKGETYEFEDAPFYAEKNWGGAFPIKWYWCQCNSFTNVGDKPLAVTAGGGTRKIPLGQTESLGMVSVHYDGVFYEATPWLGDMEWNVSEWGHWNLRGKVIHSSKSKSPSFEVELNAVCDVDGVKLRAPTERDGMAYFCRDSFFATATLSLWELEYNEGTKTYERTRTVIDAATSTQAAVELGGGPWWDNWTAASKMKQPMKGMVRLPYRLANLKQKIFGRSKRD